MHQSIRLRILPNPGQKTITMSGKRLKELEQKYNIEKKKHPTVSFASFIAESALMELERRQIIREAFFISLIDIHEDVITLKDARNRDKFIEVQIKNNRIKCLTDNKQECIHVGFVLALPEVRKALKEQG